MKKLFVVLSLAGIGAIASCGGRGTNESDRYGAPPPSLSSTDRVDYAILRQTVLAPRCFGCHGSGSDNGDFTSAAGLAPHVVAGNPDQSELYTDVNSGDMPQGGPKLSDANIDIVRRYIEDLAPATGTNAPGTPPVPGPSSAPSPGAPPSVVTYSQVRTELITPYCARCHGAGSSRGDFSTYDLVKPNATNMYNRIQSGSMPPSGTRPSADTVARFKAWIDAGFPQ